MIGDPLPTTMVLTLAGTDTDRTRVAGEGIEAASFVYVVFRGGLSNFVAARRFAGHRPPPPAGDGTAGHL